MPTWWRTETSPACCADRAIARLGSAGDRRTASVPAVGCGGEASGATVRVTTEYTDPRILKALSHPLRVEILRALDAGEVSPAEIARSLGRPLGTVSYHFKLLEDLGLIELARTTPRRGAVEHHYAAVALEHLDVGTWDRLPAIAKHGAVATSLAQIAAALTDAPAGAFDRREARVVFRELSLDAEGWKAAAAELDAAVRKLRAIERASRKRAKAGARVRGGGVALIQCELDLAGDSPSG